MKYTKKGQGQRRMKIKIGSHVSNNGDEMLVGSVKEALSYDENCFMLYLGAPQNTYRKPFNMLHSPEFIEILKENNICLDDVIVHAPYIVNLAQSDPEKREFAVRIITQEMKTMAKIGLKYLVIHPGCHMKLGVDKGLELISQSFKEVLENTKGDNTIILIETMAGKGSECCFEFSQVGKLIDMVGSSRVMVCFDTCHTNDAGYDLVNNYEGVLEEFDRYVGLSKIKVFHINDSLNERGSHKDRHANIGFGTIGFDTLTKFIYDERFEDVPKILETPYVKGVKDSYPPYKEEIKAIRERRFNENLLKEVIEKNEKSCD